MEKDLRLALFPYGATVNHQGHLVIGGCDTVGLVREYGTPLYVFDETTLRRKCTEFRTEFIQRYPKTSIVYACKAFLNRALALILKEEGLGLDVVSAGELAIAHSVAFPLAKVYFHGNNKKEEEIKIALDWSVGYLVVDNFYELTLLDRLAKRQGIVQNILLRLTPGVDPHTHNYTTTGVLDVKFGFPLVNGEAERAVAQAMSASHVKLVGLHCHLGSPIFEIGPYEKAIDIMLQFVSRMKDKHDLEMLEFSLGGGFAIQYLVDAPAPSVAQYAEAIAARLRTRCQEFGLPLPRLIVEPGRAIVGQAGVALYQIGVVKDIPGVRRYVCVDGGMSDNIRPALYGARYEALVANKVGEGSGEPVTIAGKLCESGDILIKDIALPPVSGGDIIAVPASGAYCIPMSSNYNLLRCDLIRAKAIECGQ
jgi:diaminopimelate decarboxylase